MEGIPEWVRLGNITYVMQVEYRDEKFEWAFEWMNRPGEWIKSELNAYPTKTGYGPPAVLLELC